MSYEVSINISQYTYMRKVEIQDTTGLNRTSVRVRFDLSSSNFNFGLANSDGSDFRVAETSNGTGVFHIWIATWDSTREVATIWVLLPSLTAYQKKKLYVFWGILMLILFQV